MNSCLALSARWLRRSALLTVPILLLPLGLLLAEDKQSADPEPIRFVSYNLRNYLKMDRRVEGESRKNAPKPDNEVETMLGFLQKIEPDMLGVSEMGEKEDAVEFQARLKKAGIDLPEMAWLQSGNSARTLAIYSRFPIVEDHSSADLEYEIGKKVLPVQRGLLDVEFQINENYRLRVIGLHLKSKRPVPEADQAEMRRNEAHLARKRVDEILAADPKTNLLVHGDLNDTRNEPPVRALQGKWQSKNYLKDIRLRDKYGATWTYHWDYADQYSRFDFVLASKGLLHEVDEEKSYLFFEPNWYEASDHRPLVLSIVPREKDDE